MCVAKRGDAHNVRSPVVDVRGCSTCVPDSYDVYMSTAYLRALVQGKTQV